MNDQKNIEYAYYNNKITCNSIGLYTHRTHIIKLIEIHAYIPRTVCCMLLVRNIDAQKNLTQKKKKTRQKTTKQKENKATNKKKTREN